MIELLLLYLFGRVVKDIKEEKKSDYKIMIN